MTTFTKLLLAAISIFAGFSSCIKIIGAGPGVTETRNVGDFTSIVSQVSADVNYIQAAGYHVKISAQQNVLNAIETYTSHGELIIRYRDRVTIGSHEPIHIEVSAPEIHSLKINGSGNIVAARPVTSPSLALSVSGSGNINLNNLAGHTLSANISGSGNINILGGEMEKSNMVISGSGHINTTGLATNIVTTITSGSGRMSVQAIQKLDVTISGSGSVFYSGNPEIKSRISGSGKVIRK